MHGPAVVGASSVRLLELGDGRVGKDQNIVSGVQHLFQRIQQLAELLFQVGVALAVAKALQPVHLGLGARRTSNHHRSAQSAVSMTSVPQGIFPLRTSRYLVQQHRSSWWAVAGA